MIKHIVFFKTRDAEGRTAEENAEEMITRLKDLVGKIPELVELEAGRDVLKTPASWDVALYTSFQDLEALETYRVHPAHQEVVNFIKLVTSDRAVVDYDYAC